MKPVSKDSIGEIRFTGLQVKTGVKAGVIDEPTKDHWKLVDYLR